MNSTVEAFPLYLSSNACPQIFPRNTPTDFRTRLSKPLNFSGQWEVGVKNICYNSHIVDDKENAQIHLSLTTFEKSSVNKLYDYNFITDNGKWPGFDGIHPEKFETDIDRVLNILNDLNAMNKLIFTSSKRQHIFQFSTTVKGSETRVRYSCQDASFSLKITPYMAKILGFGQRCVFDGIDEIYAERMPLSHALNLQVQTQSAKPDAKKPVPSTKSDSSPSGEGDGRQTAPASRQSRPPRAVATSGSESPGQTALSDSVTTKLPTAPSDGKETLASDDTAKVTHRNLKKADYKIQYFSTNVQKHVVRQYFKLEGQADGSDETIIPAFLKRWNEYLKKATKVEAVVKDEKLVLVSRNKNIGIQFSPDFMNAFTDQPQALDWVHTYKPGSPRVLFGEDATLELHVRNLVKINPSESWYVDVYNTNLDRTSRLRSHKFTVTVQPWHHSNMNNVLKSINEKVQRVIKGYFPFDYSEKEHAVQLSMQSDTRVQMSHGKLVIPRLSKNLAYLLGMPADDLHSSVTHGIRDVNELGNHRRQLHVLSNIIQVTSYGEKQRHILCDFLHKGGRSGILEKSFKPIIYQPLNYNTIDTIHIQIQTEDYKSVTVKDSDTVITLHFRRIK